MKTIMLVCALAACGHPAPVPASTVSPTGAHPSPPAPPAVHAEAISTGTLDDALTVRVQLRARRDRMTFDVEPYDTLHTSDYVELHVEVNAQAYVYVVQLLPSGNSTVLFPGTGDLLLTPHHSTRIPCTPGEWYKLDDEVGTETVYVVASRQPIASVDEALGDELRAIRHATVPPDPIAEPAPAPSKQPTRAGGDAKSERPLRSARPERLLTMANRGLRNVVRVDGRSVLDTMVLAKDDRVVVARFSFRHEH